MTKNQIEYLKLRETQRSNRAQEDLSSQKIRNDYKIASASLDETSRHNVANEGIGYLSAGETSRHNIASEALTAAAQSETHRANIAAESERARANRAQEALTKRNLDENERYHNMSNALGYYQAGAQYASVALGHAQLAETSRANRANEAIRRTSVAEEVRHNIAAETEINRSNTVSEAQRGLNIQYSKQRNDEIVRHNLVTENLQTASTAVNAATDVADTIVRGVRAFTIGGK